MGRYGQPGKIDDYQSIKWAPENSWCVSLGIPIGNDLDESQWWSETNQLDKKENLTMAST
eukprot:6114544-Prymnesium_polylepis.1